jgi:DNA-binding response OmpR family regulator
MVKVLVLEDDACSALALCSLFEQAGAEPISALDTQTAMEEVRRAAPDLLVADLNVLGNASSIDVAHELRRIRPDARVVFVSGYSKEDIEEQVVELQPCSVFTKPMNFEALLDELELAGAPASGAAHAGPVQPPV